MSEVIGATVAVRQLSQADAPLVFDIDQWAFGLDVEGLDRQPHVDLLDWSRVRGAYLDGQLRGVYAVLPQDLPVPGGSLPCAGVTWVGVHPTARRRGLLTAMMRDHLAAMREPGGAPVSALYAAEVPIYGRFGYGMAFSKLALTVPRGAALRGPLVPSPAPALELDHADLTRHGPVVSQVYERARQGRPGWVSRADSALADALFHWPARDRQGAETLRILIARGEGGEPTGYALFGRRAVWTQSGPEGVVVLRELVALDAPATLALWGFLLDLDLTTRVEAHRRPVDDPLLHLLVDARAARPTVSDGLFVRLVDVPAALAARRYLTPVDVVLEVADAYVPQNARRWRLRAGPSGAGCEPTDEPADLALDVRELGSAYLGGVRLLELAAAGLVQERRPGALASTSAAFGWTVTPYCPWSF